MHRHFKIYKPYGYLSQFITRQKKARNKNMLGELGNFPEEIMAVGRLDEDSEGLLLLTTNGKVSFQISSKQVEKEYFAQVDGKITPTAIARLREGLEISVHGKKFQTMPCKARRLEHPPILPERRKKIRDERHGPTSWISITLKEGKFRQVKKMTAAVGFPTLRLVRVRIGNFSIEEMKAGEVVEITSQIEKEFTE